MVRAAGSRTASQTRSAPRSQQCPSRASQLSRSASARNTSGRSSQLSAAAPASCPPSITTMCATSRKSSTDGTEPAGNVLSVVTHRTAVLSGARRAAASSFSIDVSSRSQTLRSPPFSTMSRTRSRRTAHCRATSLSNAPAAAAAGKIPDPTATSTSGTTPSPVRVVNAAWTRRKARSPPEEFSGAPSGRGSRPGSEGAAFALPVRSTVSWIRPWGTGAVSSLSLAWSSAGEEAT